jgi:hypothetical protein
MSMRVHKLSTHLRPEEAITLIEFLDLLREVLIQAYGDDITQLLRRSTTVARPRNQSDGTELF